MVASVVNVQLTVAGVLAVLAAGVHGSRASASS
jgi:hypothetical protein